MTLEYALYSFANNARNRRRLRRAVDLVNTRAVFTNSNGVVFELHDHATRLIAHVTERALVSFPDELSAAASAIRDLMAISRLTFRVDLVTRFTRLDISR